MDGVNDVSDAFPSIEQWKNSFLKLRDNVFFQVAKRTLGVFKTPYNKQRIIDDIAAFLTRPAVQEAIRAYITEDDHKIIAAIALIPAPNRRNLAAFFDGEYGHARLREMVVNLEDRLIVCRGARGNLDDEWDERRRAAPPCYALNPLLKNILTPFVENTAILFPKSAAPKSAAAKKNTAQKNETPPAPATDIRYAASVIAFLQNGGELFKSDGELRKKAEDKIKKMYGGDGGDAGANAAASAVTLFLDTYRMFMRLGIITDDVAAELDGLENAVGENDTDAATSEGGFEKKVIEKSRLEWYASLDVEERLCYAAAWNYFSRFEFEAAEAHRMRTIPDAIAGGCLASLAAFFASCLHDWEPRALYCAETVKRLVLLTEETSFAAFFGSGRASSGLPFRYDAARDALLDTGLIVQNGQNISRAPLAASQLSGHGQRSTEIIFDGPLSFVLCPEINFYNAVMVSVFAELTGAECPAHGGKGGRFSYIINAQSAAKAFTAGYEATEIAAFLSALSGGKSPQNLEWQLKEWEKRYSEVTLFEGLALVLSPERRYLVEVNPLKALVLSSPAPGVYFLNTGNKERCAAALRKAGIDMVRTSNKNSSALPQKFASESARKKTPLPVPPVRDPVRGKMPRFLVKEGEPLVYHGGAALKRKLSAELAKKNCDERLREYIQSCIDNRLIVSTEQLNQTELPPERLEARGLDFQGKLGIARAALDLGAAVEITVVEAQGDHKMMGYIADITRPRLPDADTVLTFDTFEHGGANGAVGGGIKIPFARLSAIRRVRSSMFDG